MAAIPPPNAPPVALAQPNDPVPQAAATAGPPAVAPPWFQSAMQQLRDDIDDDTRKYIRTTILPELKRLKNRHRGDGTVVRLDVIPFANGDDPTEPPNTLPPLYSVKMIDNLNGQDLDAYLTGYGIIPLPVDRFRRDTLKQVVGTC